MSADKDCQTKSEVDLCIFKDIFRRADKNDDGAISWTEFVSYFSDGIVTDDGMRNLFNEIDSHNTNNIDTHELCIYFTERLGSHEPVFESAGSLCRAVSASVKSLAETHARKPPAAQFVDRFLLREMCAHLEAQLQVLRNAHESLCRRARESASSAAGQSTMPDGGPAASSVMMPPTPQSPPPPPPRPPPPAGSEHQQHQHHQQHQQHQNQVNKHHQSPSRSQEPLKSRSQQQQQQQQAPRIMDGSVDSGPGDLDLDGCLHWEVARLQRLLDRLESRTALVTGRTRIEEAVLDEDEAMILIVRRRLAVQEEQLASFLSAVRKYSSQLEGVTSCLLLSIRQYRATGSVTLYEFWESLGSWRKFLPSPVSRDLRRALVDCTDAPESTDTMLMPSSWWKNMDH
uniref:EF-hand domain-containing protein n=1 Tax=Macrostomum lignano TaxID=282301 RepID=A0A1I8GBF9_9PLAT